MQWIVVPDLSTRQLSLSSLILGLESVSRQGAASGMMQWSVDKRFQHGAQVRFITFIYNAARRATAVTDLAAQVQVIKDDHAVITSPFKKVALGSDVDTARVPFTEEVDLRKLHAGRYVLRVTVEDRAANKSVSQQAAFYVQ